MARSLRPGVPFLCVGRGSNLLVADEGFAGVAVLLDGALAELSIEADPAGGDRAVVVAGGGVRLPVLARQAAAAGWGGLEFFVGIPGSVGGAVRMNAGGHGKETVEVLRRAWVVDLGPATAGVEERPVAIARPRLPALEPRCGATSWCRPSSPSRPARRRGVQGARSTRSCGGAGPTSPAATTPARCSPTHPATPPAGSSTPAASRVSGSARPGSPSDTPTSSRPSPTAGAGPDVVALVLEVQRRVAEDSGITLVPELRRVAFAGMVGARPGAPAAWPGDDHAALPFVESADDRRSSATDVGNAGTPKPLTAERQSGGGPPAGRAMFALGGIT